MSINMTSTTRKNLKVCIGTLICSIILTLHCSAQPSPRTTGQPVSIQRENSVNPTYSFKIIDAPNNTYGYDIFAEDMLIIHQPSIPALPGNEGFKSKIGAEKIAQLVITKTKKGEMPPTITIDEMKKLKAIK